MCSASFFAWQISFKRNRTSYEHSDIEHKNTWDDHISRHQMFILCVGTKITDFGISHLDLTNQLCKSLATGLGSLFPSLQHEKTENTYRVYLLWTLKEIIYRKHLALFLTPREYSANISHFYYYYYQSTMWEALYQAPCTISLYCQKKTCKVNIIMAIL